MYIFDMNIEYRHNYPLDPSDVARVFEISGIRRPCSDIPRIARMFAASNLVLSAWFDHKLVGVSRALTDHAYCCYLSDLAIDKQYQHLGIGKELIRRTRVLIGDQVSLILFASPEAMSYYPKLGFELADNAYIIRRTQ